MVNFNHYKMVFFFNDTATTEIYTLSLHDALPIYFLQRPLCHAICCLFGDDADDGVLDRKSTRLNSSHDQISYAVFCLKNKQLDPKMKLLLGLFNVHLRVFYNKAAM